MPQALNRFAATSLGQPGVAQSVLNQPDVTLLSLVAGATKSSAAEILARAVVETTRYPRLSYLNGFKLGLATDVLISVGFQLYGDSHDPFLMTGQRIGRVGVAAFGGGLSTLGSFGAGFAAGWLCGPGVVICAPVGIVVGSVATSYG